MQTKALFWISVTLILAISAGLRLYDLSAPDFWTDEIFTEIRATAPIDEALETLYTAGNQGPFYYLMLRPLPNNTEFELRMPSVVMGVIGVGLLMFVALQLYQDRWLALWVGLLLAISPFHIMISRHARAYALLLVLCLMASYFFLLLIRPERRMQMKRYNGEQWLWFGFTLFSGLAYLTHYSAGALGVAQLVYLWLNRRRHDRQFLKKWIIAQTIASIPFLIWVLVLVLNFESTYTSDFSSPSLSNIPVTFWNIIFGYDGEPSLGLIPAMILVGIGLMNGWVDSFRQWRNGDTNFYWVLLTFLSIVPVIILAMTITPAYQDRYFTVFVPAVYLLLLLGWRRYSVLMRTLGLSVILLTSLSNTYSMFEEHDYQRADWEGVNEAILSRYQAGDGLLFEEEHPEMAFEHYYTGHVDIPQLVLESAYPIEPYLFEARTNRIWVVYRNPIESFHRQGEMPDFDPFDADLNIVGAWLAARKDRVVNMREFAGVTLLLVED